jgi:hypothetical protein
VKRTSSRPKIVVTADGRGVVGHAGARLPETPCVAQLSSGGLGTVIAANCSLVEDSACPDLARMAAGSHEWNRPNGLFWLAE